MEFNVYPECKLSLASLNGQKGTCRGRAGMSHRFSLWYLEPAPAGFLDTLLRCAHGFVGEDTNEVCT